MGANPALAANPDLRFDLRLPLSLRLSCASMGRPFACKGFCSAQAKRKNANHPSPRETASLSESIAKQHPCAYLRKCRKPVRLCAMEATSKSQYINWRTKTLIALSSVQTMTCAICGRKGDVIDHDHATGFVRGILCAGCNALQDGPGRHHPNHVRYRENPPAAALPKRIQYLSPQNGRGAGLPALRPEVLRTEPTRGELILKELEIRPASANDLAASLRAKPGAVRVALSILRRNGLVVRDGDVWKLE